MTDKPATVSVVIPTLNSERWISGCLASARRQTHPPLEVIIVDGGSTDGTVEASEKAGKVIISETGLTRARLIGAEAASGDYVLNLDSDQILGPHSLESALVTGSPVVAFEEVSSGKSLVARINRLDKVAVHTDWQRNLDPVSGFIRPRFYRRDLLLHALNSIPPRILDIKPCPYSEDSLIFWHSGIQADQVGYVRDAIFHEEERNVLAYLKKWRVYGRTARSYRGTPYAILVSSRGKRNVRGAWKLAVAPGLVIRAVPFIVGYYI